MADTPASAGSQSTILEDSILVEEPAQKSGSDLESDEAAKPKRVGFAPLPQPKRASSTPTSPMVRSSRYTISRGGRSRAERGDSSDAAAFPSVQAVIEAYEAGKRSKENPSIGLHGKSTAPGSSGRSQTATTTSTDQRTAPGDSYNAHTPDVVSPTDRPSPSANPTTGAFDFSASFGEIVDGRRPAVTSGPERIVHVYPDDRYSEDGSPSTDDQSWSEVIGPPSTDDQSWSEITRDDENEIGPSDSASQSARATRHTIEVRNPAHGRRATTVDREAQGSAPHRTSSGDSYRQPTVDEPSPASSSNSAYSGDDVEVIIGGRSEPVKLPPRDRYKRTRFANQELDELEYQIRPSPSRRPGSTREHAVYNDHTRPAGRQGAVEDEIIIRQSSPPRRSHRRSSSRHLSRGYSLKPLSEPVISSRRRPSPRNNYESDIHYGPRASLDEYYARSFAGLEDQDSYRRRNGERSRSRSRSRSRRSIRHDSSTDYGLHRRRPPPNSPAPIINVYNRMDDQRSTPYSPYPPPPSASRSRTSPPNHGYSVQDDAPSYIPYPPARRPSPDFLSGNHARSRLESQLADDLADIAIENRFRSRSRGRSDILPSAASPSVALVPVTTRDDRNAELVREYERKQVEERLAADQQLKACAERLALEEMEEEAQKEDEAAAKDESDTSSISTGFDFVLPKRFSSKTDEESARRDGTPAPDKRLPMKSLPDVVIMPVLRSRWHSTSRGTFYGSIETTTDNDGKPEFVWAHIHKSAFSFSDLEQVVMTLPELAARQKDQITAFLDEVRSKHERQKSSGLRLAPSAIFCNSKSSRSGNSVHFASVEDLHAQQLAGQGERAPNAHRKLPLLEALKPGVDLNRERKQVLSRTTSGRENKCVHVSPTWLLAIGDAYLITASPRSATELLPHHPHQKAITQPLGSPPVAAPTVRNDTIRLTYGARSWTVSASDCRTWPGLWAIFLEAFAERAHGLSIMHGTRLLDSRSWKMIQQQERVHVLELRIIKDEAQRDSETIKAMQQDLRNYTTPTSNPKNDPIPTQDTSNASQDSSSSSDVRLLEIFGFSGSVSESHKLGSSSMTEELHKIMSESTVPLVRNAYRYCDTQAPRNINVMLQDHVASRRRRERSPEILELVISFKNLYGFFWPSDADHEMLSKFRATLRTILDRGNERRLTPIYNTYDWRSANDLLRRGLITASWISTTFADDHECFPDTSPAFIKAWLHLQTAATLLSMQLQLHNQAPSVPGFSSVHEAALRHLELFVGCMEAADEALVRHFRTVDVKQNECARATGIFWLTLSRLMSEDSSSGVDISDTYRQYLAKLDPEITNNPTDRALQERLRMYIEEAEGLRDILDRNFAAIARARDARGMGVVDANQVRPPLGGDDPRLKSSRDTLLHLRKRRDQFNELAELAAVLQSRAERAVGEVKNDQEKAIYLFTIVTVIFLPLSFVSSLFGMNTNDIRNLDSGQWIFWVVAIPVTVLVIGACLWFAGGIRLGLGWTTTYEKWKQQKSSDVLTSPPSYQDAIGDYKAWNETGPRQPDRNMDAFEDRYKSPSSMPLRHVPRSGLDHYSTAGDDYDRYGSSRRHLSRRRTAYDY